MTPNAPAIWLDTVFANFDFAVHQFITGLLYPGHVFFTPFLQFISNLCYNGIPLIILAIILIIIKKTRRFGTAMLMGLAIGALITNCCLKLLILRSRPYTVDGSYYQIFWQLVGALTESDNSFPSGHTTAAFASMTAVFLTGNKKISWTAYIFAFLVAISRIYLTVHYATDVLAGMIVGIFAGCLATFIASKITPKFYGRPFFYPVFITTDKHRISDTEHMNDFNDSESIGRCTFGKLGLYYKDLGKKYIVSYDYIDRAFVRVSECAEDEFSQNYNYFRVILEHVNKEFANLIYNKEDDAREVLCRIKKLSNLE